MGRRLVFRAVYTPIQTKYINVNITFERVKTNGHDFNILQNRSALQRDGQSLSNTIIKRNDYVDVGALNMEIRIPLHQSPFIQEFKIIGEGHLKKIQDNNDKDRKEYNDSTRKSNDLFKLSYDLFGLVIKGSLIF